jgi:hypothetical protein
MLTFEVASFDIGYNYILEMYFLLKFMAIIHTTYATIKMTDPKGVITIKADQLDVLASENASLPHAGRFGDKVAQDQAAKIQGGSTLRKTSASTLPQLLPSRPPIRRRTIRIRG